MTYQFWLDPIVGRMPLRVRQMNMVYMSLWAAVNPLSGSIWLPPFYGLIVYLITFWWLYNRNPFNMIRSPNDPVNRESMKMWLLRAALWAIIFHIIPLVLLYLLILFITKASLTVAYRNI